MKKELMLKKLIFIIAMLLIATYIAGCAFSDEPTFYPTLEQAAGNVGNVEIEKIGTEGIEIGKDVFTIADFVDVRPLMMYAEVMELLGRTWEEYPIIGNTIGETFDLNDGSKMMLTFEGRNWLISMSIIDPSGRTFVLRTEHVVDD